MTDQTTTIQNLKDVWKQFVSERAWEPFHSPKNLVMGMAVEIGELMEHFLWMDNAASLEVTRDQHKRTLVAEEIADVTGFILCLCNALDLDLSNCIAAKLQKNAEKYPVEKYRGRYEL